MLECSFRLDPTDKKSSIMEFENISKIVTSVPIYYLNYSRQEGQFDSVMKKIATLLDR